MNAASKQGNHWTIDKRIPVSVILTIMLQTVGVMYWAMNLDNRVVLLERTTVTTENYGRLDEKITGLKNDMGAMRQDMTSVKEDVRRLSVRSK